MNAAGEASQVVAVLGTGLLGSAIATNLARHGYVVRVWNRSIEKSAGLRAVGCLPASSVREAVTDAHFVLTVLADASATEHVLLGDDGASRWARRDAVLVQVGTIGVGATLDLARKMTVRGLAFVDAPVSGSRDPALNGQLVILAGGDPALRESLAGLFAAMGRRTLWSDRAGDGTRLKLALNSWLGMIMEAIAEAVALCRSLHIDPEVFLSALEDGPLDMPYAQSRGRAMIAERYRPVAFPLALLGKDAELALAAAAEEEPAPALPALSAVVRQIAAAGRRHAHDDMTAIYRATQAG